MRQATTRHSRSPTRTTSHRTDTHRMPIWAVRYGRFCWTVGEGGGQWNCQRYSIEGGGPGISNRPCGRIGERCRARHRNPLHRHCHRGGGWNHPWCLGHPPRDHRFRGGRSRRRVNERGGWESCSDCWCDHWDDPRSPAVLRDHLARVPDHPGGCSHRVVRGYSHRPLATRYCCELAQCIPGAAKGRRDTSGQK